MLRIHFTAKDLARVVIAHSSALPVSDAVMSLQVLRRGPGPRFAVCGRHVLERLFADLAPDGRFNRIEEATRMLKGSDADRNLGSAR